MKILSFIIVFFSTTNLFGSCHGPIYSITELLNYDERNYQIFTCEILETYVKNYGFESKAVVRRKFKGSPKDTILINTGGSTTAGGEKLYPNSKWLIFSSSKDNYNYGATVCDFLSTKLEKGNGQNCERDINSAGKVFIEVLEIYEDIKQQKFSGYKKIQIGDKLLAEGRFLSGEPDGDWIHYSRRNSYKNKIKKSEITYSKGILHGIYSKYYVFDEGSELYEKRVYERGRLMKIDRKGASKSELEYNDKGEKVEKIMLFDSLGRKLFQKTFTVFNYSNKKYDDIGSNHGYYLNKNSKDSSRYSPLAEGRYFRGARVGEWKFFNKKGHTINVKSYPEKSDSFPKFQIFDDLGNIRLTGKYKDGKRVGPWKYYYDNKLEHEKIYNADGDKILKISYYSKGSINFTPYLDNQKHGQVITVDKDKTIRSIVHFKKGKLHGRSTFFNQDGIITKELDYKNSRAFTILKGKLDSHLINGRFNGHKIYYYRNTWEKRSEGEYWNGYKTGVWTEYSTDGSYTKIYYPTDKKKLMNQCPFGEEFRSEKFDKNGKLKENENHKR